MARQKNKTCLACQRVFRGRSDAKTCSERCRKRLQRAKISLEQDFKLVKDSAEDFVHKIEVRVEPPYATEGGFVGEPPIASPATLPNETLKEDSLDFPSTSNAAVSTPSIPVAGTPPPGFYTPPQAVSSVTPTPSEQAPKPEGHKPSVLKDFSLKKIVRMAPLALMMLVLIIGLSLVILRTGTNKQNGNQNAVNNQPTSQVFDSSISSISFNRDTSISGGHQFKATGQALFRNNVNSSNAFSVQNAAGSSLISVDTKTGTVTIHGKLDATNIVLPSTNLGSNVTQAGNTFNGASELVQLGPSGILPALNGSALTSLNASAISEGTLSDTHLSLNVPLKNADNNTFKPGANSINTFQIQNSAGTASLFNVDTLNRRVAINQSSANYTLDVNGDINVTAGGAIRVNGVALCSGSGCTAASGSGSYIQNRTSVQDANFSVQSDDPSSVAGLLKGASGQTANIFQVNDEYNDTVFSVGPSGDVLVQPSTDSTNAFWVQNAAGTSHLIGGDTVNDRVAIAKPTPPSYTLDVGGDINSSTAIRVGGNIICQAGGCTPGAGSGNYIQNSTSLQSANLAIQSPANSSVVAQIRGASGQTADLLDVTAGDSGQNIATFGARGNITFQNATDSTTAFQIQNQTGTSNLFIADTTNSRIGIGATPANSLLTIGANTTTAAGGVTFGTDTSLYRSAAGTLILTGTNGSGTLQAAAAVQADTAGSNLMLAGGLGTGTGSGGNINLQIAKPSTGPLPNQSFITGTNSPVGLAVNSTNIYWSNSGNNTIGRANLDGTSPNQSFITGTSAPYGIALDGTYIYWVNQGNSTIGRAKLDGTNVNQSFITGLSNGAAIAVNSSYIYWTNHGTGTIGRANLDGTGVNQSFVTGISGINALALDSNYIYWSTYGGSGTIGRANLDGTGANSSFITSISDAAYISVTSSSIYWGSAGGGTVLGRANIDGSNKNNNYVTGANNPNGVAADSNYLYWANYGSNAIGRYNITFDTTTNSLSTVVSLSGTNGSALFQNATDSTNAFAIQNVAGTSNLFVADTSNTRIGIGASPANSLLTIGANTTTSSGGITFGTDTSLYRSGTGALTIGGTGSSDTLQAATAVGTDATGSSLILAGGKGTGLGNGGNINFQIAQATSLTVNESFISGISKPYGVTADSNYIYWTSYTNNAIGRANLDGSGANQSFITGLTSPSGVVVNGSYIYWTNVGGTTIGRANLDGTGVNNSFITGANAPDSLTIDSNYIYWTNAGNSTIGRAKLDGTSVNQDFITPASQAIGVAVDSNYIYWSNYSTNAIGRAKLDGTGANNSFITGGSNIQGIAVNSSYIYWVNYGNSTIGRANLDGTGVNQSFITGANSPARTNIGGSYLYWSNSGNGTIGRYTFAGNSPNPLGTVASISGSNGSVLFQNASNSTTALQIQNAAGTNIFTVDTQNGRVNFPDATSSSTGVFFGSGNELYGTGSTLKTLSNFWSIALGVGYDPSTLDSGTVAGFSGNVAIGTTNSSGYKLYVNGNSYINGTLTVSETPATGDNSTNVATTAYVDRTAPLVITQTFTDSGSTDFWPANGYGSGGGGMWVAQVYNAGNAVYLGYCQFLVTANSANGNREITIPVDGLVLPSNNNFGVTCSVNNNNTTSTTLHISTSAATGETMEVFFRRVLPTDY